MLEGAQAGLSWQTILNRRRDYVQAFLGFDPKIVASFDENKIAELLKNKKIIRNKLKIISSVNNAHCLLKIQQEHGSFDHYLWQFVDGKPIQNHWEKLEEVPCQSKESLLLSKDLKKRGFKHLGM